MVKAAVSFSQLRMSLRNKHQTACINLLVDPTKAVPLSGALSLPSPKVQTGACIPDFRKSTVVDSRYHELFERLYDGALVTNLSGLIVEANVRTFDLLQFNREEICKKRILEIIVGAGESLLEVVQHNLQQNRLTLIEASCQRKDGTTFPAEIAVNRLVHSREPQLCFFVRDISRRKTAEEAARRSKEDLERANHRLQENQSQLAQSEKMAAIGQIAAGVAHEINNPVGFLTSNLVTLGEYVTTFKKLLERYDALSKAVQDEKSKDCPAILKQIESIAAEDDLPYVLKDIEHLLSESADGANRVKEIVQNLKSFARVDESELKEADINEGIEATLKIVWNELKYKCRVHKTLQPLPTIHCYAGQLNQVFMNLLVNAAQAIQEEGDIYIETAVVDRQITIRIADSGKGIAPENMSKLFTPFFTTKPVGKGTGLGLSISYGIVQKHNGTIDVKSEIDKGTSFTIRLPIEGVRPA